ncbi:TPA: hypothetical protein DEB00_00425 [Candidatus Uhrbacteria bacterium]|nr:hypothetical protein [Candidatus Uhrbacteria bacterium]
MEGDVKKPVERLPVLVQEQFVSPELTTERRGVEVTQEVSEKISSQAVQPATPVVIVPVATPAMKKDPQLVEVESILSEGLNEIYGNLPQQVKPAFRAKGEEVAQTILLWKQEAKLVASRVLRLIRDWLRMVPKLNKHYLEQESKIKTDHILALAEPDHFLPRT